MSGNRPGTAPAVVSAETHSEQFFRQCADIASSIDSELVERLADEIAALRERSGRLFFLGVGGSAANCAHAVNDFRKLCGVESYSATDNVSELTARINDDGWDGVFAAWLKGSNLDSDDAIMVLSVGGGNQDRQVSVNLIQAIDFARERGARVLGIVGRDGGYAKRHGDVVVVIPTADEGLVTPHSEAFQGVVWHSLVSNPKLQIVATKW